MKNGLGIDIGGTNTKILVINEKKEVLKEIKFKTESEKGKDNFIERLASKINEIKKEYKIFKGAIAMAGDIDSDKGMLRFSPNLSSWKNFKIVEKLNKKTNLNYILENDANLACWGAYVLDLNKKPKNIITITMGTGIGSGIIIDGKIYHGFNGVAGEVGHMVIEPNGKLCACGNHGCLEAYCSSKNIIEMAKSKIEDEEKIAFKYGIGENKKINTIALALAAEKKEKFAIYAWEKLGFYLGIGLGNLIMLLNPEYIIITGGVSKGAKFFMPKLKETLLLYKIKTPINNVKIKISKSSDLGSLGAALLSLE